LDSCIIKGNVTFGDSENIQGECVEGVLGAVVVVYMDEEFEPDECEACNVDDLSELGGDLEFCAYRVELPCDPIPIECGEPSASPSEDPTSLPTIKSSLSPSSSPSASLSDAPSDGPSLSPSGKPSASPSTLAPSESPTKEIDLIPPTTAQPTESMMPTDCHTPAPPKVIESMCMTTGGELMNETISMPEDALVVKGNFGGDMVDFTVSQKWTTDEAGLAIQAGLDSCIIKGNVTFGDSENIQGECVEGVVGVVVVVYMDEEFEPDECEACNVDDLSELGGEYEFCAYRVEIPCEPISVECAPSAAPTDSNTTSPTGFPSSSPTDAPTAGSTDSNTTFPTASPSSGPTKAPAEAPSAAPTDGNTTFPTASPSSSPTKAPADAPSAAPSSSIHPTECPPDDPILISNEGETMYPELPVKITFQNTSHVGFKVENTFAFPASSIFSEYHSGSFGETECLEEENVENNSSVEIEFLASCMVNTKISIINIWVTDCSEANSFLDESDNAEIPECCHPGEKCRTVQYTFKLPCVDPCPEDEVAALPITDSKPVGSHRNLKEKEINKDEGKEKHVKTDDHFCVVEDYPCGPDNDKVHVCHYSARDGYKTFCVPEADSDALRFYPKDYCGPCVGGYADTE